MKAISLIISGLIASISIALGGGNTSVAYLTEVHSVKVEPEKITIVGTGHVEFRIMTDREPANSSAFGQPANSIRAAAHHVAFEIVPYGSDPEVKGVPIGDYDSEEVKTMSKKLWEQMKGTYASVRAGDSVTIGYQQDRIIISESRIQRITGAGSVHIHAKANEADKDGAEQPAPPPDADLKKGNKTWEPADKWGAFYDRLKNGVGRDLKMSGK